MGFSLRKLGRYDYATYATYIAYSSCSVIVPVLLIEIAQALNFPLESGGQGAGGALQIGRSLFMVIAMIFCGFAAGRWGKRLTVGTSVLLMGLGIGLAAIAPSYGVIFLALAFAGFGGEIVSTIVDSEAFFYLDAPIKRVGGAFCPVPFNPVLEAQAFPTPEKIEAAIRSTL